MANADNQRPVETLHLSGYSALDRGDYGKAMKLATECLNLAAVDSYWHFGALGLRCWAANYLGDDDVVKRDAASLLAGDAGASQQWFRALACLNLGLMHRRRGRRRKAEECFAEAERGYSACRLKPGQPADWAHVYGYFSAASRFLRTRDVDILERLLARVTGGTTDTVERQHVRCAIDLLLRRALGDEVLGQAEEAAQAGVSRALLGPILLATGQ